MPVAPCRGGEDLARRLFEALGYLTRAQALPLDPQFPESGDTLGIEALERFVAGEPLYRVHECVFTGRSDHTHWSAGTRHWVRRRPVRRRRP